MSKYDERLTLAVPHDVMVEAQRDPLKNLEEVEEIPDDELTKVA